jgi:RNA polymerase sigma-70 factor, ECF subfamily
VIATQTVQVRFEDLFCPVQPVLRAFLYAATRSVHDTDDLLQQVSAVLWRKFDQFDPSRPFTAWAVGIAHFEIRKWREKTHRSGRLVSISDESVAALAEACIQYESVSDGVSDDVEALRDCVGKLVPAARQAIEMKYRDGVAIREIAAAQGREVGAVEMALVRARRALRQCIEAKNRLIDRGRTVRDD